MKGWEGYALWFIPVLFVALLLAKLVMQASSNKAHVAGIVLLMVIGASLRYTEITLPWTMSSVPYSAAMIIIGSKLKLFSKYIDSPKWWILVSCFVITCLVSHFWRLDIAWNNVTPATFLSAGAIAGTIMIFTLSSYIVKCTKFASQILQSIGKETYIILAFSQISIMLMNTYFPVNSIIKYCALMVILVIIKYLKDAINKLLKFKLL